MMRKVTISAVVLVCHLIVAAGSAIKDPAEPSTKESRNHSENAESLNLISTASPPEDCFCSYDYNSDYLKASRRDGEVRKNYKILKGERVLFSCRYPNMDIVWPNGLRIFESAEIACDICQDWQRHHLPECETRVPGDSFILYDSKMKIMPGGIIEVSKSENITITCINLWLQPNWHITPTKTADVEENPGIESGKFYENITISGMNYEHIGRYECFAMIHDRKLGSVVIDLKLSETKNISEYTAKESQNTRVKAESLNPIPHISQPDECFCTYDYNSEYLKANWRETEIKNDDRIKKGEKVLFSCRYPNMDIVWPNGIRFFQSVELVCDICENWQREHLPECETHVSAIYCSVPSNPKNGRVLYPSLEYGTKLRYECDEGFKLQNHLPRICTENKIWSNDEPECIEIQCPLLDETNIFLITYSNSTKLNSVAFYSCKDANRKLIGSSNRTCLHFGKWSGAMPVCKEISCPILKENSVFLITYSNKRKLNSVALYDCRNTNQRLIGSSNRTCLHSGEWSGTIPVCEDITCLAFQIYENLTVTYSKGTKVNSVASFNCLNHASLVGSTTAICLHNGTWNHPKPLCKRSCLLSLIEDGELGEYGRQNQYSTPQEFISLQAGDIVKHNEVFILRCIDGYSPGNRTEGTIEVTCNDGTWSESLQCSEILCHGNPPEIENGLTLYEGKKHGHTAWYRCNHGYKKIKAGNVACKYGKWEGPTPVCSDLSRCEMNELDFEGLVNPKLGYILDGENFPIACAEGYDNIYSKKSISCFRGQWNIDANPCRKQTLA